VAPYQPNNTKDQDICKSFYNLALNLQTEGEILPMIYSMKKRMLHSRKWYVCQKYDHYKLEEHQYLIETLEAVKDKADKSDPLPLGFYLFAKLLQTESFWHNVIL